MSQLTDRGNELFEMDMHFNGSSYIGKAEDNKDFNVHHTEMVCDSEDVWNKKIEKMKKELERRRNE